ncbi:MAG: hypothetical protein AB7P04_03855 [Bacteriovoracia bacterium]
MITFLIFSVFFLKIVSTAHAKFSPETNWETVTTAHFRVHYAKPYARFTTYLIDYLEEAYEALSPELNWKLRERVDVVVSGDSDIPNGLASVFPFNRLVIYATPFSPISSIGEYDNWIRTLAYHELTHIIANDTTHGGFATLRSIFGSAAKMNFRQPLWLIEGLAVFKETVHGWYGRGRSAFFDMAVRTAVRDGLLDPSDRESTASFLNGVTLDRLNDGPPGWPGGIAPYLYGYVMYEVISQRSGLEMPGKLSYAMGGRLPFFLNTAAQDVMGVDYYQLWKDAVVQMQKSAELDLRHIRQQTVTPMQLAAQPIERPEPQVLSGAGLRENQKPPAAAPPRERDGEHEGRMLRSPAPCVGTGDVYYIRDAYESGTGISRWRPRDGSIENLSEWDVGGGIQLRCVGEGEKAVLVYSRYDLFEGFKTYSDLYYWDVKRGRERRLTWGARASDPDASPDFALDPEDSRRIKAGALVYVKNLDDGNQAIIAWDGKAERSLVRGERFERFGTPAWGRGEFANWIVYSEKLNGGNERLSAVNASTGEVKPLTRHAKKAMRVNEVNPSWTHDGAILYASSLGGIFNIFRIPAPEVKRVLTEESTVKSGAVVFAKAERLSHVETGAFFPVEWPDSPSAGDGGEVLATLYDSSGFRLARFRPRIQTEEPVSLASLHTKLHIAAEAHRLDAPDAQSFWVDAPSEHEEHAKATPEKYSVWPTILPQYWLPYGAKVSDGWTLGAQTEGGDALDLHGYALSLGWDSRATFPVFHLGYRYDGLYPSILVDFTQENRYVGIFQASNRVNVSSITFFYPVGNWAVSFGAALNTFRFSSSSIVGSATTGGLQATLSHSDVLIRPHSIEKEGGEAGHRIDLRASGYLVGAENFSSLELSADQRVRSFWKQHFWRLQVNAGKAYNDALSSYFFVGGGEGSISKTSSYLLRGYPSGEVFGRSILTANLEYWFPLEDIFAGHGTFPIYRERLKLKLFLDVGSAEYVAGQNLAFARWPYGVGINFLADLKFLYHFPWTLGAGFHWGLNEALGGEKQFVLGFYSRAR